MRHYHRSTFPDRWHRERAEVDAKAGLAHLRAAASLFECCPKTLARVRLAISSAKGAVRNAETRVDRKRTK
jgi:hypothetical protein